MTRLGCLLAVALASLFAPPVHAQDTDPDSPAWYFYSSLHRNRTGMDTWYGAANGGFEAFTGIPMEQLGCKECHGATNANGLPYPANYMPGCYDCHPADGNWLNLTEAQCYGCHSRQKTEAVQLGLPDVHRAAGMVCWDCHDGWDMHGYGIPYASMFDPRAIDVDCTHCHLPEQMDPGHAAVDPHAGKLHCAACHTQSVISCYNCHFESQVVSRVKRARQPISDFVLLGNREKDGKVYPMSFQSLSYQGTAFVAFAPYSAHTIVREGRTCTECHVNAPIGGTNEAIAGYNATGQIRFASLAGDGSLSWIHGVVPMPEDYQLSFRLDFITYDGNTGDPPAPGNNWSSIGKDTWDGHQMLYIAPLTGEQMAKLGMAPPTLILGTDDAAREGTRIFPPSPNPFAGGTRIAYATAAEGPVRMSVHDLRGRVVDVLVDEAVAAGRHVAAWDGRTDTGRDAPAGVYFIRLVTGEGTRVEKVLLAR